MSAHSHYLFSTASSWGKLSSMELMGAALNILFSLCLPLLSTSTFQQLPVWHLSSILAPQAQWDIRRLFLFFFLGGRKKSCCTQLGIQYHGRAPWAILAGMAKQDRVTRGPGGWLCPPCSQ